MNFTPFPSCRTCAHEESGEYCKECFKLSSRPCWSPSKTILPDPINHPTHYLGRGGIEPVDFIISNKLDWLEGNIVKYVYRYPFKGGLEDLKKARFYLERLIEEKEKENE